MEAFTWLKKRPNVGSICPTASVTKSFVRLSRNSRYNSKVSSLALDTLPRDVIKQIADTFLSPKDRLSLSSCNRQLRACLPKPLVIEIGNIDGSQRLKQSFFVTPYKVEQYHINMDEKDCYCQRDMLYSHQALQYGQEYIFWDFDYTTDSPVYLGRHSRHDYRGVVSPERLSLFETEDDKPAQCITIALRKGVPMQAWQVVGNSSVVSPGDPVVWEDVVGLVVRGKNPIQACHQDSMEHSILSCFPDDPANSYPNWMVLRPPTKWQIGEFRECAEWGLFEKVRLRFRTMHRETVPTTPRMRAQSLVMAATPVVCQYGEVFLYGPGQDIEETHAFGHNGVVQFQFWIDRGIAYYLASNLEYSVAIPILKEDGGSYTGQDGTSWGVQFLQTLLEKNSGRWDIIKYYMAVAADQLDGAYPLPDKDTVMRKLKEYHRDYSAEYREEIQSIHVNVKGGKIRDLKDDGAPLSLCFQEEHLPKWTFVLTS